MIRKNCGVIEGVAAPLLGEDASFAQLRSLQNLRTPLLTSIVGSDFHPDRYRSFFDLALHEPGAFKILARKRNSPVLILAPHGGMIEHGTSELAQGIAAARFSLYCFSGLVPEFPHHHLHIASHRFDEPHALRLASQSQRLIAVHGCLEGEAKVFLGGLDGELKRLVADSLSLRGFTVDFEHPLFPGERVDNICNRSALGKGVQLEISLGLRRELVPEKGKISELGRSFCCAVREAAGQVCGEKRGVKAPFKFD